MDVSSLLSTTPLPQASEPETASSRPHISALADLATGDDTREHQRRFA